MLPLSIPKSQAREERFRTGPLRNHDETWNRPASSALAFISPSDAPRPVALWHLASLDAPTVAVVWSLSFAWMAHTHLPLWFEAALALSVWTIYVGDRLLDARSAMRELHSYRLRARHYFHWRHRKMLVPMAIAAICSAALLVLLFMPAAEQAQYAILTLVFLAYLARIHLRHRLRPFLDRVLSKELLVGVLFTIGCAVPTLRLLPSSPGISGRAMLYTIAFFALLAWLNCSAINTWESQAADRKDRVSAHASGTTHSLRIISPRRQVKTHSAFEWAILLAIIGLLSAAWMTAISMRAATLLLAGGFSAVLLACLDHLRNRLSAIALRAAADLALLTPALFIAGMWTAR
jgi:hypothetical protein